MPRRILFNRNASPEKEQRPAAGLRLIIELKRYGQKNEPYFCPIIFCLKTVCFSNAALTVRLPKFMSLATQLALEKESLPLPLEVLVSRIATAEHIGHQVHDLVLSQQAQ
jgi:hypothetical protein